MRLRFLSLILFSTVFLNAGCKGSAECVRDGSPGIAKEGSGPRRIYVPEYYVYRNGRYVFVKGHYRLVLSRALYYKRTMRGYGWKGDRASVR